MKRPLLLAALLGSLLGAVFGLARGPQIDLSLWLECDDLPDPKGYIEATAPANKNEPAVVHVYWNPTGGPIDVGSAPYWLIRARPVEGGVFIEVEWPTKPGTPWLARLDWKGGPMEGMTTHWMSCP